MSCILKLNEACCKPCIAINYRREPISLVCIPGVLKNNRFTLQTDSKANIVGIEIYYRSAKEQ